MSNKLDELFDTEEGKKRYGQIMMGVASRASLVSCAAVAGISPTTLSKWVRRGKSDLAAGENSRYCRFFQDVMKHAASATVEAEIELNQQDPKTYLTRGFGRFVVNDLYNYEGDGKVNYNADGTISEGNDFDKSLRVEENDQRLKIEEDRREKSQDEQMGLEALSQMRESGIDVNEVIDRYLSSKK